MIESEHLLSHDYLATPVPDWEVLSRTDLEPYFSRLGLCNKRYIELYNETDHSSELSSGLVILASDSSIIEKTRDDEHRGLIEVCAAIAGEIDSDPNVLSDPERGWNLLAYRFLDHAELNQADAKQYKKYLTTAFTCAQYVTAPLMRTKFLEHIYITGHNEALYDSIKDSGLNFIHGEMATRYRMLSQVFKIQPADLPQLIAQLGLEHDPSAKPKALQKKLAGDYSAETSTTDTVSEANCASIPPPNRATFQREPWKIERFALQQVFIEDQMRAMFPDGSTNNSVLAEQLQRYHKENVEEPTSSGYLEDDLESAIRMISAPIIEKYRIGDTEPESLTREQQLNARFRRIHSLQTQYDELQRYLYPDTEIFTRADSADIWSIADSGADVPARIGMLIRTIRLRAVEYIGKTGECIQPQELYALANSKRKALLTLATKNIFEMRAYRERGAFRSYNPEVVSEQDKNEFRLTRSENGRLHLDLPIEMAEFETSGVKYNATTLGCAALRASLRGPAEDRRSDTNASNNYVDYILEVALQEASRRGLFDVTNLLKTTPVEN